MAANINTGGTPAASVCAEASERDGFSDVDSSGPPVAALMNVEELERLKKDNFRLQSELDEARSLVAVANYSLEESLETERRKCKEEVATLQQLMKGNFNSPYTFSSCLFF